MFAVNAAAFVCLLAAASFEAFKFRIAAWTSRIAFELGWMSLFWVLETGIPIFFPCYPFADRI
jgi:hypothetical protein